MEKHAGLYICKSMISDWPRRTGPTSLEKLLNGTVTCIVLNPDELGDSNLLWVGSKNIDVVGGVLTLGPNEPYSKDKVGDRAFHVNVSSSRTPVVRRIEDSYPFPRALGSGEPFERKLVKGPNHIQQVLKSDLERNESSKFLALDTLPQKDLVQVAHHFMDCLTTNYHDRLRLVARALDGATVRLATTCSGLETSPSILRAIFRPCVWLIFAFLGKTSRMLSSSFLHNAAVLDWGLVGNLQSSLHMYIDWVMLFKICVFEL